MNLGGQSTSRAAECVIVRLGHQPVRTRPAWTDSPLICLRGRVKRCVGMCASWDGAWPAQPYLGARTSRVASGDMGKPAELRETHRVLEDTHTLTGPRKSDPPLTVRRILVHSTANAADRQAARSKRLAKATEDLNKLTAAAGGRHYRTREKIVTRIGVIAARRRVTSCLRWTVTGNEDGTPVLAWHFDAGVLDAEAAVDGWYALLTSVPADQADAGQVLVHYKGQGAVERRYHDFQGPARGCAGLRPAQPARRRPRPGDLSGPAGLLSDRAAGQTGARPRADHERSLP